MWNSVGGARATTGRGVCAKGKYTSHLQLRVVHISIKLRHAFTNARMYDIGLFLTVCLWLQLRWKAARHDLISFGDGLRDHVVYKQPPVACDVGPSPQRQHGATVQLGCVWW